jgi:hypothetical protein
MLFSEIINDSESVHNITKNIKIDSDDVEYLTSYFSYAKALLSILDHRTAEKFGVFWPHLNPADLPLLKPVPDKELEDADLGPKVRRNAETTKKAGRQLSSGSQ